MKPDQERVNNLLRDTVTLLCKNGLTYSDELRVEALIGVTVDSNDVFLVHINERFGPGGETKSDRSTPAAETAVNNGGQACNSGNGGNKGRDSASHTPHQSPAHGTHAVQRTGSSDSGSVASPGVGWGSGAPPRQSAPQVDLSRVKLESVDAGEDIDGMEDCLVVRSPQAVAHQARMVAGQRRAYSRHNSSSLHHPSHHHPAQASTSGGGDDAQAMRQQYSQSHSMASSDGSFTDYDPDTGEPPLKIKKQAAEDQGEEDDDDDSAYYHGGGSSQDNTAQSQWPNLSDLAAHQAHQAFQETGDGHLGADAGGTLPGCSTWPMPAGSQRSLIPGTPGSDMTVYTSCHQNKYPSNNLASRSIREGLLKYLAEPVDLTRFEVHSFRIVWRFDEPLLDYAWIQLVQNHLVSDQVVAQVKGVAYFVSALTGIFNKPNRKGEVPRNIYPAVSYWVVARRGHYNHLGLWKDLQTAYPSAQIKAIGSNADLDSTEAISSALYIVLKDHSSGYVRNRVDASAASCLKTNRQGEHPLVRLVLKDRSSFENELLQAVSALDALRMNMTLTLAL